MTTNNLLNKALTPEQAKLLKVKMLEQKLKHQKQLPHLHKHKFYKWQREFFTSLNRMLLLTAANQIGKSTIQIIKTIELAINKEIWRNFWPKLAPGDAPNQFWYLYPSGDVATAEFETKWLPLMPCGEYKDHPVYGWKELPRRNGKVQGVKFNSGVLLLFKVYEQDVQNLQSGTVFYIGCDEELPYELYNELKSRTRACAGFFSMAFTATLGQEFWRLAMEPKEDEKPNFPNGHKIQVSLYDCMFYEDGSPGQYDEAKIQEAIDDCSTENEVLRRVYGRFVKSEGLMYPTFSSSGSLCSTKTVPQKWIWFVGIDSGSGTEGNDPAAIVFVAVSPDYKQGYVVKSWRGDDQITTSDDIIKKYVEMKIELGVEVEDVVYDFADKDLHTIATRMGLGFNKADKNHERGQKALNTLFKNNMLQLFRDGDNLKLSTELSNLSHGQRKPVDHLTDALRYVCVRIPWDWSVIAVQVMKAPVEKPREYTVDDLRRGLGYERSEEDIIEVELDEANDLMGS